MLHQIWFETRIGFACCVNIALVTHKPTSCFKSLAATRLCSGRPAPTAEAGEIVACVLTAKAFGPYDERACRKLNLLYLHHMQVQQTHAHTHTHTHTGVRRYS